MTLVNKLIGIGVGPGNPELMTYQAVKTIQASKLIFVPVARKNVDSLALEIASSVIKDQKIIPLVFPMIPSMEKRKKFMKENIEIIKTYLNIYKKGVFLTIGDPSVYATYMYLVTLLQKEAVAIKTIPGISSFSALCSKVNIPLALDDECFCVFPLKNDKKAIEDVIYRNDTVVFMKISRAPKVLYQVLKEKNYFKHCILASNIGKSSEFISQDLELLLKDDLSYFTTLVFKKGGIYA